MNNFEGNLVIIGGYKEDGSTLMNIAKAMDRYNNKHDICPIAIVTHKNPTIYVCKRTNKTCMFEGINHDVCKYTCDEYIEALGGN